ncbi:precorrin-6y C5,15-methyltransferase (decarboxylating) subunit CbiE [Amaricoccus solimangrovi]|uniref:Precorrin-6y C5,15-methyltransferase (Decarboxylating) subunit CbiE n=1 Tax=Amaricoccus solimangrovi TaxID=2589815 RepID=A0A501WYU9_9RHOB|nr:precorrin-6y C5,15-methyltransferase (decarboxylating) subunit CbiE [Amaricoccus solimangrovi]TPE53495.1 precorrin-6y C5,15-methyltransferase (decarboxylating) subunit CbiE [Amaricoccus solimangrovi]
MSDTRPGVSPTLVPISPSASAAPWLTIIGLGEDGLAGLSEASRDALDRAEFVFGAPRHLALAGIGADRARPWPVPFSVEPLVAERGRAVAALVSGDPFWHGAGAVLAARLAPGEWRAAPAPSCFSLAAARLGWPLERVTCLALHAAPVETLRPHLARGARLLCTLRDSAAAAALAGWLTEQGLGMARLAVLEALGGPRERIRRARAAAFDLDGIATPVAVAIDLSDAPRGFGLPRTPGLAESRFASDGQITKSPVRALTLAALAPRPGEHLWDIGAGSGSVSVEWLLAAPGASATAVEPRADRGANIAANARAFGLSPRLRLVEGRAPECLDGLAGPEAVFVGGGGSEELFARLWEILPEGTRLVANAVTLETEALLTTLAARRGGELIRIELSRAEPLGSLRAWQAARPVTQWSVIR